MTDRPRETYLGEQDESPQPIPAGKILVPQHLRLDGEYLRWELGSPSFRESSPKMLDEFITLKDGKSVLAFARNWGVLALAEGALPADPCTPRGLSKRRREEREEGQDQVLLGPSYLPARELREGREPIAGWLYYSRRARAVLRVAKALSEDTGGLGDRDDWGEFLRFFTKGRDKGGNEVRIAEALKWAEHRMAMRYGLGFSICFDDVEDTKAQQRAIARGELTKEVNAWVDLWKKGFSGAKGISDLSIEWQSDRKAWGIQVDYHGKLFAAIALRLALAVANADDLYVCSGCNMPYIRPHDKRRPKTGCQNYCRRCVKGGVDKQRASKAYRTRKMQGKQ